MRSAVILGIAVALAVRVIPAYPLVFEHSGVNFQDNDSWYHVRSIRNLAAHFPHESGFDPYSSFPGGRIHQSEPWDMAVASVAWVLGAGKPGAALVDEVAAWLPAIFGAMLPIPVFLLGRRLFGDLAEKLSAISVAIIPGTLLWETHLGVPDHHVAEALLALTALTALCYAAESRGRARIWLTATAGIVFGAYLCVRPAGIFVPAILALATLDTPSLAPLSVAVLALASAEFFVVSAGAVWSEFTALALAGSLLICAVAWALGVFWRRRRWHRAFLLPAAAVGVLAALGILALVEPATLTALTALVRRYLPGHDPAAVQTVRELSPIWGLPTNWFPALYDMLGGVWFAVLSALVCAIPLAWRARRPVLTLCAVWGLVMTVAGVLQLRMFVYSGPCIALAAGAGAAWLIGKTKRFHWAASAAFVVFLLATSLPAAIRQTADDGGPNPDWRAALAWLRNNTPEPMGDAAAWQRYWPRLAANQTFHYPASAYGVLTWWDFGDWVGAIAHRVPSANGNQTNAGQVASFLTDTDPGSAHSQLEKLGARYVVLSPASVVVDWPATVLWAGRDNASYRKRIFTVGNGGKGIPIMVYLPDFYRSMSTRLYLFDGKATPPPAQISVFTTRRERAHSGGDYDILLSAWDFMTVDTREDMTLGSTDPAVSCVQVEGLPWVRQVFTSDAMPLRAGIKPHAVRIFEITR